MKCQRLFFIAIVLLSLWFPGFAQAQQDKAPIVRLIYYVPSDREPQPDIDAKLDTLIRDTQQFFADQMEAHGFGRKTFRYETDAAGKAVVHHLKSKFPALAREHSLEINARFSDFRDYISLVALESDLNFGHPSGRNVCGLAHPGRSTRGGIETRHQSAYINNRCFNVMVFAHELGHLFGLAHDWRTTGKWIPSEWTRDPMVTSFCAAEWLDGHPAFNTDKPFDNMSIVNTTVKMLPPSLTTSGEAIRLGFEVSDPDGLHQIQLKMQYNAEISILDFKGVKGVTDSTVEWITTELPMEKVSLSLDSIDMKGYISNNGPYPINASLLLLASEDPHSEVAVRREIGIPTSVHATRLSLPENAKVRLGKGAVIDLAYSPDGTRLAVASTVGIWLYNAQTYQELALFTGHTDYVNSVAFSPDGQTLASGSKDRSIRLWDISTGKLLHTLTLDIRAAVESVAFSPDGKKLASAEYGRLHLWDVSTANLLHTFIDLKSSGSDIIPLAHASVAFSPDGQTLASMMGGDNYMRVWDVETGTLLHEFTGDTESVAFSPNGKMLASPSGESIRLWNVENGEHLQTLTGHNGFVFRVAFSPDGQMLASGYFARGNDDGGPIILWDVQTGKPLHTLIGHTYYITSVAFSPDGQTLASGSGDGTLRFWDVTTGTLLHTSTEHIFNIHQVALSPDGQMLASASGHPDRGSKPAIHLWDVGTGQLRYELTGHPFKSIAFSPDGQILASGSFEGVIGLWDIRTGRHLRTLLGPANAITVHHVVFSPDGQILASAYQGSSNYIDLWDVGTGSLLHRFIIASGAFPFGAFPNITFSPDGKMIANGGGKGTVQLWDVNTATEITTLIPDMNWRNSSDWRNSIAFSPDGQTLVSMYWNDWDTQGESIFWNVDTGKRFHTFTEPLFINAAFSPDGHTLVGAAWDREIGLYSAAYDVSTGSHSRLYTLTLGGRNKFTFRDRILRYRVTLSQDIKTLASWDYTDTVLLWDTMLTPTASEETRAADVNGDGEVNIQDLVVVAAALGQAGENDADVNRDGEVNIQDLVAVAAALGEVAAAPAVLRQQGAVHLTQEEVQHYLTQAQQADLTDATSVRGIRFLEQLLSAFTPKETALLPNYPNPFNPETWIPYQLSEPAAVRLIIYDIQGRVVRDLDLGHQRPGMYQSRARAAYWDGRNAQGESVASGVYFYTLSTESTRDSVTAGDFSATRKMLIRK